MKITIATLFLILSTTASAESHEEIILKQRVCRALGEDAATVYQMHKEGREIPAADTSSAIYALYKYSNEAGMTATSAENAHMMTWGKCMDNLDYLQDFYKVNQVAAQDLHY